MWRSIALMSAEPWLGGIGATVRSVALMSPDESLRLSSPPLLRSTERPIAPILHPWSSFSRANRPAHHTKQTTHRKQRTTQRTADMDELFLEGLEVPCRVGCTDPERATPQSLRVGVRLFCPGLREAGVADDLEKTVDYRLAGDLIDAVQGREYLLIERVAE